MGSDTDLEPVIFRLIIGHSDSVEIITADKNLREFETARSARARRRMHEGREWLKRGGSMQDEHDRAFGKSHALKLDFHNKTWVI